MATLGPVTITCPGCGTLLDLPAKTVVENVHERTVLVRLDYTGARAHFLDCQTKAATVEAPAQDTPQSGTVAIHQAQVPAGVLAGRIHRLLDMRAYITPGTRACSMCGTSAGDCHTELAKTRVGCCSICTAGDTHPVPGADLSCAEWAAKHLAGSQ